MREDAFFKNITDLLLEDLSSVDPNKFENPFTRYGTGAFNIFRNDGYSLCNTLYLNIQAQNLDVRANQLAGYSQWKSLGYQIIKDSKSLRCLSPSGMIEDEKTGETVPKGFNVGAVFSFDQVKPIEGQEQKWTPPDLNNLENPVVPVSRIDHMVKILDVNLQESKTGGAYYSPSKHSIYMPPKTSAKTTNIATATENYYSVLLHELTHWTAHKDLCERDISDYHINRQARAYEELIAEMGSLFFTTHFNIRDKTRVDHAQYISSWIKLLKDKPGTLKAVSKKAQEAVNLCLEKFLPHDLKSQYHQVEKDLCVRSKHTLQTAA